MLKAVNIDIYFLKSCELEKTWSDLFSKKENQNTIFFQTKRLQITCSYMAETACFTPRGNKIHVGALF